MRRSITLVVAVAALAGCSATQPPPHTYSTREAVPPPGGGALGDLRWNIDPRTGKVERLGVAPTTAPSTAAPTTAAEQEEYKKWQESAGASERKDFEDWRAWQEWKRRNPK
jgi:putative VirB-like lipoprotein